MTLIGIISLTSCEDLDGLFGGDGGNELTTAQVVEGLKEALEIGTDSSVNFLSAVNGYYLSEFKIPLPEEIVNAQSAINEYSSIRALFNNSLFSFDGEVEKLLKAINRSAEEAAREAAPIFKKAITDLSVKQAWDILNGIVPDNAKSAGLEDFDSTAATQYFLNETSASLTDLYAPKIMMPWEKI
ncbi:MAG: DUF4197 domain-containing protein [Bacteroidales bacterium]|nr:DUF4197 domain-containing protein [Bacteroidales bacterium]